MAQRMLRKFAGHPITKIFGGMIQQDKIIEHYGESPSLVIREGYTANFQYLTSNPEHYRRFVILKILNEGSKAATGCWASITINELKLTDVPLHWSDEPYNILRNSMETITIPPAITRELDVAFSVYGTSLPTQKAVITSGNPLQTSTWTHASANPTKGTFDPSFKSTGIEYNGLYTTDQDVNLDIINRRCGAWIASHLVLAHPIEKNEHYLPPNYPVKRYHANVKITCNEGVKTEIKLVLLVTPEPEGLNFDERLLPVSS